jgi:hypothetical protein
MRRKIIIGILIVLALVFSFWLMKQVKPYFVEKYDIDPYLVGLMFLIAEVFFNLGIVIMLWFSGVKDIRWKTLWQFKLRKFKVNLRNPGALFGLWMNRLSWILPCLYLFVKGWNKFPWWVEVLIGVEIAITLAVGFGVLELTSPTEKDQDRKEA